MFKKIGLIALAALALGGCSLTAFTGTNTAVSDQKQSEVMATSTPVPTASPDTQLQAVPATSSNTDAASLETDINNTTILNEDYSDIK